MCSLCFANLRFNLIHSLLFFHYFESTYALLAYYIYLYSDIYCFTVDGSWGAWSSWGTCTVTCGGGSYSRSRQCDDPAPANGGLQCPGDQSEFGNCNNQSCPVAAAGTYQQVGKPYIVIYLSKVQAIYQSIVGRYKNQSRARTFLYSFP